MHVFLPLPLNKTWDTLSEIELGGSGLVALPDPQLYIIVNGVPTKDKIVWQTLVDVNAVKLAIQILKEINWLYKNVDDASLDSKVNTKFFTSCFNTLSVT